MRDDITEIKTTNGLLLQAKKLDQAIEVPAGYMLGKKWVESKFDKAVYNNSTGNLSKYVSKKYQIIQHRDVFESLAETLNGLNMNVYGRLDNLHDYVKADLVFGDKKYNLKDDAKGVQIGIRAINSYNKKSSFRLEMFGFRMICQNGMSMGSKMGVREITMHTGKEKTKNLIATTVQSFIKEVINNSSKLQQYINDMMKDSIEWKIAVEILKKIIVRKKHYTKIQELLGKNRGNVTRWDIYNAITDYASHGESLSAAVERRLEKRSQKVLNTPLITLAKQGDKHE